MGSVSDERALRLGRLEIDDVIQETYTRLVAAQSVSHVYDARSYAFQIAGSVVIDHLRRMKVVSIASVPDFDYLEVVSDDPSPERQAIDRDELHRLAQTIARLPGKVRDVFTLRRVH